MVTPLYFTLRWQSKYVEHGEQSWHKEQNVYCKKTGRGSLGLHNSNGLTFNFPGPLLYGDDLRGKNVHQCTNHFF